MTYIPRSVSRPSRNAGSAAPKDPNVTIIAIKDIAVMPVRDDKGVLMAGNFVAKDGASFIQVYMTPSKIKAGYETDGDEDSISYKHTFEGEHPGNELEIAEFIQNWTGEPCLIVVGSCSDDFRKVYGTKCAPMVLRPSNQDDNDKRVNMLKFEQFAKAEFVPGHYTGNLVFTEPFEIPSNGVGSVALTPANGVVYKVPALASTAAIVAASNTHDHGTIITLLGSGGAGPATLSQGVTNNSAILKNGTQWAALAGSYIHLEVYKAGALTFLIEKNRG